MSFNGWNPYLGEPTARKLTVDGEIYANIAGLEQIQQRPGSLLTEITVGTNLLFSSANSQVAGLDTLLLQGTSRQINGCYYLRNEGTQPLNILIGGGSNEVMNFMTDGDQIRASMNSSGVWDFQNPPTTSVSASNATQLVNLSTLQLAGKPTREFWVSKQGVDTNPGSITAPFLTIQAAINACEALPPSSSAMCIINVDAGIYVENLTHTLGYITIRGGLANIVPTGTTIIDGSISIAIGGSDDLFGKQINYSGLQINGAITDTSTAQHSISFTDCYLYSTSRNLNQNTSATDARTYLINCFIQQSGGTGPQIETQNGRLVMERCNVATNGNYNQVSIAGASVATKIAFNDFQNSNSANNLSATIIILSSSITSHNIGGNTIAFTTLGAPPYRSGSPYSSGIHFNTGAVNPNAVISQNVFALLGTTDLGGANHCVSKDAGMTGNVSIVNAGNYAFAGTTKIQSTITQIASSIVS